MHIETICDMLPRLPRSGLRPGVELIWLAFASALMVLGYHGRGVADRQTSPGLGVPMSYPYYGMVVGGAYLLLVAGRRIGDGAGGRGHGRPSRDPVPAGAAARHHAARACRSCWPSPWSAYRHGRGARSGVAAVRPEDVRAARLLHAAGAALLHPRGRDDVGRRHEPAAGGLLARAGRPPARRPRARRGGGQHGVRRRLGLVHGRRLGDRLDRDPDDEEGGLQARLRRGADRRRRDHRRDHPAEHDDGRLRLDRAGLDRRPVPRRHHSGHPGRPVPDGGGQAVHLCCRPTRSCAVTGRFERRAILRAVRRGLVRAAGAR